MPIQGRMRVCPSKVGNQLLFFDDVEEEFGIGGPDDDAILSDLAGLTLSVTAALELDRIPTIRYTFPVRTAAHLCKFAVGRNFGAWRTLVACSNE